MDRDPQAQLHRQLPFFAFCFYSSTQRTTKTVAMVTALVTGSSRGIGLELVRQLLAAGHRVIATCRTPAKATDLQEVLGKYADQSQLLALDVSDEKSVEELGKQVTSSPLAADGIDWLINNAGVSSNNHPNDPAETGTKTEMLRVFTTNVVGPMLVTQAMLPLVKASNKKVVLNMSSTLGSIELNTGGLVSYRTSKAALNMMTKTFAGDFAKSGMCFAMVHPGWVDTDMGSSGGRKAPVSPTDSVRGLMGLLNRLGQEDNGKFFTFEGKQLPW
eukprot:m.175575 g.175575  ORF g.175575 m.175575 type:complete len:273 (-) comp17921_c0_seq13:30-848(-)